jgi:hypothetical protein
MTKKSPCTHCQAVRTVQYYEHGTIYSIRITHQPDCQRPRK